MPLPYDVHDYTIEVCVICGCQLSRNTPQGRCLNSAHWSSGGMVVRVIARDYEEQNTVTKSYFHVIPKGAKCK